MRIARLTLFGLALCLLAACGSSDITAPATTDPEPPRTTTSCGYLGSAGCP